MLYIRRAIENAKTCNQRPQKTRVVSKMIWLFQFLILALVAKEGKFILNISFYLINLLIITMLYIFHKYPAVLILYKGRFSDYRSCVHTFFYKRLVYK